MEREPRKFFYRTKTLSKWFRFTIHYNEQYWPIWVCYSRRNYVYKREFTVQLYKIHINIGFIKYL